MAERSKRVLVLGAYGLLGASLCPSLQRHGWQVARQGRRHGAEYAFDPGNTQAVLDCLTSIRPDVVINLAAATSVDACEDDPGMAYDANVCTVEGVVKAIQSLMDLRIHLVQMSTDHVYDGAGPHTEEEVRPCNVYALTKFAGELVARQTSATVLRGNLFGRSRSQGRSSLSDWLVDSLRKGSPITVFADVLFGALHLDVLSDCIVRACERRIPGTFNVGTSDCVSKADFAETLAGLLRLDTSRMLVGSSTSGVWRARRPLDMRMKVGAFESSFGVTMPTMQSQIELAALEYLNE